MEHDLSVDPLGAAVRTGDIALLSAPLSLWKREFGTAGQHDNIS